MDGREPSPVNRSGERLQCHQGERYDTPTTVVLSHWGRLRWWFSVRLGAVGLFTFGCNSGAASKGANSPGHIPSAHTALFGEPSFRSGFDTYNDSADYSIPTVGHHIIATTGDGDDDDNDGRAAPITGDDQSVVKSAHGSGYI